MAELLPSLRAFARFERFEIFERVDIQFSDADYFYEEIRKELFSKFGKEKLYSEGLIIKTALDSNIQNQNFGGSFWW